MKLLSLKTLLLAMLAIAVLAPQAMAVDELGIYTANDGNSFVNSLFTGAPFQPIEVYLMVVDSSYDGVSGWECEIQVEGGGAVAPSWTNMGGGLNVHDPIATGLFNVGVGVDPLHLAEVNGVVHLATYNCFVMQPDSLITFTVGPHPDSVTFPEQSGPGYVHPSDANIVQALTVPNNPAFTINYIPPITAAFTADPASGYAPLEVEFTNETTGPATTYEWTFGDGDTSSEVSPTHTYTTPGEYEARLVATDGSKADPDTAFVTIDVQDPTAVAAFTPSPDTGFAPLEVTFDNLSTGVISSYLWDFGDEVGTSTETTPTYTYDEVGEYTVQLIAFGTVNDDTTTATVTVQDPTLYAAIDADPTSGYVPLEVSFTQSTTGPVTDHYWNFGDGDADTGESATHTYTDIGSYDVIYVAYGPGDPDSAFVTITVDDPAVTAGFTADPTSGYNPLEVSFTDTSTGPVQSWAWDFGDGAGTSTDQNPTYTYADDGQYTVTLTVTGPQMNTDDATETIDVDDSTVVAGFTPSDENGWLPLEVDFTDTSTGPVQSWDWDFGDGAGTSTDQNPTYTFGDAGTYTVSLTVTGPVGNTDEYHTDIEVSDPAVVANFTAGPSPVYPTQTVSFSDESTGPIQSWDWDFGDGDTSTDPDPTHVYDAPGDYDVVLTVTGPTMNTDDIMITVTVDDATVTAGWEVDYPTDVPYAGGLLDFGEFATGPVVNYDWDFGDGNGSADADPSHTFAAAGDYDVTLTVTGPIGNTDFHTETITVEDPTVTATFTYSTPPTYPDEYISCNGTGSTGPIVEYSWDFGDGTGPFAGGDGFETRAHQYATPGDYDITLTVTGPLGGTDFHTETVTISDPTIVANFDHDDVFYVGVPGDFLDSSTGPIVGWAWDFGDGSGTSTEQNPSYAFSAIGDFDVTLTITGPGDPDDITKSVSVLDPTVVAAFTPSTTTGVAPLEVDFTNDSTGPVLNYHWDFDDGSTSSDEDPVHTFAAPGSYDVMLIAGGPAEPDTATVTIEVTGSTVQAVFSADPESGYAPLDVDFTDASNGEVSSWSWDFGDGDGSSDQNPSHTFDTPGEFTVQLIVTGPADPDTTTLDITVLDPTVVAAFTPDPQEGWAPLEVSFTNESTGPIQSQTWDFGDTVGTSTEENPTYTFMAPGEYTVRLDVSGPGTSDWVTVNVMVNDPNVSAGFTAEPDTGFAPLTVDFTDTSVGPVQAWAWDFGDGSGTSTEQNPQYTYDMPGTYDVMLTVTGPLMGTDDVTVTIQVGDPTVVAEFTADPTSGYAPLEVDFTNASTGPITGYLWHFTAGDTTSVESPTYTFTEAGDFLVSLIVNGPADPDTAKVMIHVDDPTTVADFTFDPVTGVAPLQVTFTNASIGEITGYAWDFGTGDTSTDENPVYTFTDPGNWDVSLIVTGSADSDTMTVTIPVLDAAPQITLIEDVPEDQGLMVEMTFLASGFDTAAPPAKAIVETLTGYRVDRSDMAVWTEVATVTPDGSPSYTLTAPTLADFAPTSFRVVAITDLAEYPSEMELVTSTDDLMPTATTITMYNPTQEGIMLEWEGPVDPDFEAFELYRTIADAPYDFGDPPIYTGSATVFNDRDTVPGITYAYVVGTVDDAGQLTLSAPITAEAMVAAELTRYDAKTTLGGIELSWELRTDEADLAFTISRTVSGQESFVQLDEPRIEQSEGGYVFEDATGEAGVEYVYSVKIIAADKSWELFRSAPVQAPRLELALLPNAPNPFNPQTEISFTLAKPGHVRVQIYDLAGRLVKTVADEAMNQGLKTMTWKGEDDRGARVASGVYFLRLQTEDGVRTRKMMLTK